MELVDLTRVKDDGAINAAAQGITVVIGDRKTSKECFEKQNLRGRCCQCHQCSTYLVRLESSSKVI